MTTININTGITNSGSSYVYHRLKKLINPGIFFINDHKITIKNCSLHHIANAINLKSIHTGVKAKIQNSRLLLELNQDIITKDYNKVFAEVIKRKQIGTSINHAIQIINNSIFNNVKLYFYKTHHAINTSNIADRINESMIPVLNEAPIVKEVIPTIRDSFVKDYNVSQDVVQMYPINTTQYISNKEEENIYNPRRSITPQCKKTNSSINYEQEQKKSVDTFRSLSTPLGIKKILFTPKNTDESSYKKYCSIKNLREKRDFFTQIRQAVIDKTFSKTMDVKDNPREATRINKMSIKKVCGLFDTLSPIKTNKIPSQEEAKHQYVSYLQRKEMKAQQDAEFKRNKCLVVDQIKKGNPEFIHLSNNDLNNAKIMQRFVNKIKNTK